MAPIHQRRHTQPEREVGRAVAAAWSRYRELEARLDLLDAHILEARRRARAAGIFAGGASHRPESVRAYEPARSRARRRGARLGTRVAVARAVSRSF